MVGAAAPHVVRGRGRGRGRARARARGRGRGRVRGSYLQSHTWSAPPIPCR